MEAHAELCMRLGESSKAVELLERAKKLVESLHDRARALPVLALLGRAHAHLGESERALGVLFAARALAVELGDELSLSEVERALAGIHLALGDLPAAGNRAHSALGLARQTGSKSLLTRALRTLGTVTAAGAWGQAQECTAVDHFMRAIALAKETGNELELAKTYRAFCFYAHRFNNTEIRFQIAKLRGMADEIFARYRPRSGNNESLLPTPPVSYQAEAALVEPPPTVRLAG